MWKYAVYVYMFLYMWVHVYMCVCMYICMCVSMYVVICVCVWCLYLCVCLCWGSACGICGHVISFIFWALGQLRGSLSWELWLLKWSCSVWECDEGQRTSGIQLRHSPLYSFKNIKLHFDSICFCLNSSQFHPFPLWPNILSFFFFLMPIKSNLCSWTCGLPWSVVNSLHTERSAFSQQLGQDFPWRDLVWPERAQVFPMVSPELWVHAQLACCDGFFICSYALSTQSSAVIPGPWEKECDLCSLRAEHSTQKSPVLCTLTRRDLC